MSSTFSSVLIVSEKKQLKLITKSLPSKLVGDIQKLAMCSKEKPETSFVSPKKFLCFGGHLCQYVHKIHRFSNEIEQFFHHLLLHNDSRSTYTTITIRRTRFCRNIKFSFGNKYDSFSVDCNWVHSIYCRSIYFDANSPEDSPKERKISRSIYLVGRYIDLRSPKSQCKLNYRSSKLRLD